MDTLLPADHNYKEKGMQDPPLTQSYVYVVHRNSTPMSQWVIRDRVEPAASPAMSVIQPKEEENSEH